MPGQSVPASGTTWMDPTIGELTGVPTGDMFGPAGEAVPAAKPPPEPQDEPGSVGQATISISDDPTDVPLPRFMEK